MPVRLHPKRKFNFKIHRFRVLVFSMRGLFLFKDQELATKGDHLEKETFALPVENTVNRAWLGPSSQPAYSPNATSV